MISVIVPVYNSAKYLRNCLDSIFLQNFPDMEVICVNDGSTDSSLEILQHYEQEYSGCFKIVNKENGGLSSARNAGLDVANGKFVMFVDADDALPCGVLEKIELAARENPEIGAVVGTIKVVYEAHRELKSSDDAYYTISRTGVSALTDEIIHNFHCSACGILFRRDVIEQFRLRFPLGLNYEDAYWHWVYFSLVKKVLFINEPTYIYFRHPSSIMSDTFEEKEGLAIQHLFIAEKIFDFWKSNSILEAHSAILPNLLEDYFNFAYHYSPVYERSLVIYHCARIIRRFEINTSGNQLLSGILKGDLSIFCQSREEKNDVGYLRWLKFEELMNSLLPPKTLRRRIAYTIARGGYRLIKYTNGR